MNYLVTDSPFFAKGDGITDDRAAIQSAIDECAKTGGGVVEIPAGKTFIVSGLTLRTGVELHLGDNATLKQDPAVNHYVKPVGDYEYESYIPMIGHNYSPTIKWSHTWYKNYPFIYAQEGTHDFKLTGKGTLYMAEMPDGKEPMRNCPVGFYRVHHFEISGISIRNYHGYAMMPFTCHHGLFKDLDIHEWSYGNGDGICMMNCHDMRVTGCNMYTGDDSLYIFSSYKDPRGGNGCWWDSDTPSPSYNIEVDHNDLESHGCKAFGMILWGIDCPDLEQVEVRHIYVHDNHFKTMGNWLYNPYTTKVGYPPVTDFRWENNVIDGIEENFFETQISGQTYFQSTDRVINGNFRDGKCFWMLRGDAGVNRTEERCNGFINGENAALYQGLWLRAGRPLLYKATVTGRGNYFVRDYDSGETVAAMPFETEEATEVSFPFTVPADRNYAIGIENGCAEMTDAHLAGNMPNEFGYTAIRGSGGKFIFY